MKTKKMLFKAAVCLMVVMFVFSSVSALAADYVTTTTYNLDTGVATVKTLVTGATGEVAYLAYTGTDPEADGAIFHIDQLTATGNDAFEYTVDAAKVADTHSMLVGTSSEGKLSTETEGVKFGTDFTLTVEVANCKLTLTDATDTTEAPNTKVFAENGTVTVGNGNKLTYAISDVAEGYDANSAVVTLNSVALDATEFTVSADATLAVTLSEAKKETVASKEETVASGEAVVESAMTSATGEEVKADVLTKFGKVTLGDDAVVEYGIIITDEDGNTLKINGGDIAALATTDGAFAIIVEGLDGEFDGTYKVKTFVTTAAGTTYGAEYSYVNGAASIQ